MSDYIVDASLSSLIPTNIIAAEVTSHVINEDGRDKYTEYRIEVSRGDNKWSVLRRYNEFDKLNDKIKKVYPGIKLKLPKKKLFGDNFGRDFVLRRQHALNEFIQEAINYPNIMKMPVMLDFLAIKDTFNVSVMEEIEDLDAFNNFSNPITLKNGHNTNTVDRNSPDEIYLGISNNPSASPNDFEYLSVIGKGSFGKVYMARNKLEKKVYAIKVLQKSAIKKRNEVKHIMAERNVLVRNIDHPFLVALHYSFQTADKLYFVLDYVNGGELFFHLQRQRVFSENRARFYAAEISHAIGYLHSKNIIYRDLKPENILIDRDGHIKLTDFGLCKEGIETYTTTSTFCGTPEYLAPEILMKKPYTRAVDWWCLGAVLYEMLFGLPPFYSRDTNEMYSNILNKPLRISSNINVSPSARSIIEALLQKEQLLRLGNSEEDFNEIKRHIFFESINWDQLIQKQIEPPWKPNVADVTDLTNIDPEFTQEPISESVTNSSSGNLNFDTTFCGFTYVPESTLSTYLGQY